MNFIIFHESSSVSFSSTLRSVTNSWRVSESSFRRNKLCAELIKKWDTSTHNYTSGIFSKWFIMKLAGVSPFALKAPRGAHCYATLISTIPAAAIFIEIPIYQGLSSTGEAIMSSENGVQRTNDFCEKWIRRVMVRQTHKGPLPPPAPLTLRFSSSFCAQTFP